MFFHMAEESEDMENFDDLFKKKSLPDILKSIWIFCTYFCNWWRNQYVGSKKHHRQWWLFY